MNKNSKIVVFGASGLVGSAIVRKLIEKGYSNIIGTYNSRKPAFTTPTTSNTSTTSKTPTTSATFLPLNLLDSNAVSQFFETHNPENIFLAAAKVGGILANNTYKADFIYENMAIAVNVIHNAYKYGVKKLLNLGSSCIYPKFAPQPMKEEYLLTGELESTNEPYAIAKISAIKLCRYFNEQYKTNFISVMPTNLYGPGDNFNLETSHVLPALIRKFHLAKLLEQGDIEGIKRDFKKHPIGFGLDEKIDYNDNATILNVLSQLGITYSNEENNFNHIQNSKSKIQNSIKIRLWGTGEVYREFLYVDDLADACVYLMEKVDTENLMNLSNDYFVNIGVGEDIKLKDLAYIIKDIIGFKGEILYDRTRPDGTPRKLLDVSKIKELGWMPKVSLEEGIRRTYEWYLRKSLKERWIKNIGDK